MTALAADLADTRMLATRHVSYTTERYRAIIVMFGGRIALFDDI
jgi:hypothetical protein